MHVLHVCSGRNPTPSPCRSCTVRVRLRVSYNSLTCLADLSCLAGLRRLYVDENKLTELPARLLPPSLRTLSASSNRLGSVRDMECLPHLTDLHLAGNLLTDLRWLQPTSPLRRLNLAGNRLCSLSCLRPLRAVPSLSELSVADAQYGPNPLCSLHQWRVLALHSLPRLTLLDGASVSSLEVERVESLWRKKSLYYSRSRQRVKRASNELRRELATHCQQAASKLDEVRRLAWQMKGAMSELQWLGEDLELSEVRSHPQQQLRTSERCMASGSMGALEEWLAECSSRVQACVGVCNSEAVRLLASYRSMLTSLHSRRQWLLRAMDVEMESGGNMRCDESEQLTQCAARLLQQPATSTGASLQLVRAVQLRDAEYRASAYLERQEAQQARNNNDTTTPLIAQPALEDNAEQVWFTTSPLTDTDSVTPLSASAATPSTPVDMYRSALEALSAATLTQHSSRTHLLLACTLKSDPLADRLHSATCGQEDNQDERECTEQHDGPPLWTASCLRLTVTDVSRVVPQWLLSVRVLFADDTAVLDGVGAVGCLSLVSSLPPTIMRLSAEYVALRECALNVCAAVSSCERAMDEQRLRLRDTCSAMLAQLPLSLSARCGSLHNLNSSNAALTHSYPLGECAIDLTGAGGTGRLHACGRGLTDITEIGAVQWSRLLTLELGCNALTSLALTAPMPLLQSLDVSHNQLTMESFHAALFSLMPALRRVSARHNRLDWSNRERTLSELLHCLAPCSQLQHIDWGAACVSASTEAPIDSDACSVEPSEVLLLDGPYRAYVKHAVELFPALQSLDGRYLTSISEHSQPHEGGAKVVEWRVSFASSQCLPFASTFLTEQLLQRHSVASQSAVPRDISARSRGGAGGASGEWPSNVIALELDHLALTALASPSDGPTLSPHLPLSRFVHLQSLSLNGNLLCRVEVLTASPLPCLTHLSLEHNQLAELHHLEQFPALTRLDASGNCIADLTHARLHQLPALAVLQLDNNQLRSLDGLQRCAALAELHMQRNRLDDEREWHRLVQCEQLRVVDARDNPWEPASAYRTFAIFCLPHIQKLDEQQVSEWERDAALDRHCGRLTCEALVAAAGEQRLSFLEQLTLSHCRLRHVDSITQAALPNLRTLCLDHNHLASTHSLQPHASITALHCSHNRLTELASLQTALTLRTRSGMSLPDAAALQQHSADDNWLSFTFPRLQRLLVDHNQLSSMHALHLDGLRGLRTLSAAANRLTRLDLPVGALLPHIQHLLLPDNKISKVEPSALNHCTRLATLQLDGNLICAIPATAQPLPSLTALHLSDNKCSEACDLDGIAHRSMPALSHLTLAGCPITRRHSYRPHVIQHTLPSAIRCLDEQPVTADEMDIAMQMQMQYASQHAAANCTMQPTYANSSVPLEGSEEVSGTARQQIDSREWQVSSASAIERRWRRSTEQQWTSQSSTSSTGSGSSSTSASFLSADSSSVRSMLPSLDSRTGRESTKMSQR